jgi:hypothetical protein
VQLTDLAQVINQYQSVIDNKKQHYESISKWMDVKNH